MESQDRDEQQWWTSLEEVRRRPLWEIVSDGCEVYALKAQPLPPPSSDAA